MKRNSILMSLCLFGILNCFASDCIAFGNKSAATTQGQAEPQTLKKEDTVWILRSDGAKSCSPETAQSVEAGAQELLKADIRVLNSMKGDDGKMRMQMCGAPTGTLNSYLIPKDSLPHAVALGFQEAPPGGIKTSKKK